MAQNNENLEELDDFETLEDEEEEQEENITPTPKKKPPVAQKRTFINTDNELLADLQQRLIKLEYEFMFIRDKLFDNSRVNGEPKLTNYGKQVKKRLRSAL